ncbi:MAG TPA: GcrA family cell cycle regulator [Bradyrhizobium sp.]|jgi:GcrA cell cycle regulator|uniref:GcrA family cell cycle regulator n=1 Tax=Bradyrhizobium sp. TaxID=376 RepID=UPI002B46737C|nr:GcrA family cell cycle regulator [Bradyrhizobium sp.]HKO70936.1 GcrA family cell cycle regulator [Bradyrhizobium sp.]
MQENNWTPEHSEALRQYLARGLSYSEISAAINSKFNTSYSRNAALGRARRMGLSNCSQPNDPPFHWPRRPYLSKSSSLHEARERHAPEAARLSAGSERAEAPRLRCVAIVPRHLSLVDLEPNDCRYPYGGDANGEPITFCAHPRCEGSSYCTPHFHLTLGPGAQLQRPTGKPSLRVVEAA